MGHRLLSGAVSGKNNSSARTSLNGIPGRPRQVRKQAPGEEERRVTIGMDPLARFVASCIRGVAVRIPDASGNPISKGKRGTVVPIPTWKDIVSQKGD